MKNAAIKLRDAINHYTNLTELFADHMPEYLNKLSASEKDFLSSMLDFEGYSFLVINCNVVIVLVDEEAVGFYPLDSFADMTTEYINENIDEDQERGILQ